MKNAKSRAMTPFEILGRRLASQCLGDATTAQSPQDVVHKLGAIQAQDYAGAKWSIGLRAPGTTNNGVETAINERRIVRTWLMRGTLHLAAAEDVRWMLSLTAARTIARSSGLYRQKGLTDSKIAQSHTLLQKALRGGKCSTYTEIMELWSRAGIDISDQRGYLLLSRAGQEGLICFGPTQGKQQSFVLLDGWIPKENSTLYSDDEALSELTRRYFVSRGPATSKDFAWWSGLSLGEVDRGLGMNAANLTNIKADGQAYWYSRSPPASSAIHALALPGFDEYMMGYSDRSLALEGAYRHHIYTKNAVYPSTLIINGKVKGKWKRAIKRNNIFIEVTPFEPLGVEHQSQIAHALEAYGSFWGMPVTLIEK